MFIDLNLAVHYNDQFMFSQAQEVIKNWIDDPGFAWLPLLVRGQVLSSYGQSLSIAREYREADTKFREALTALDYAAELDPALIGDSDQTRVYKAINSMDGRLEYCINDVQNVLGTGLEKVAQELAGSMDFSRMYHHHLLLRALYFLEGQEQATKTYLQAKDDWATGSQHPWQLIEMYRALLLWELNTEETDKEAWYHFEKALAICQHSSHGPTLQLIGGMIATIASCCFAASCWQESARELIGDSCELLPAAHQYGLKLSDILDDPQPENISLALASMPFNYH